MRLTSAGKVGIGTSTPTSELEISVDSTGEAGPHHIHLHEESTEFARLSFTNDADNNGDLGDYSHEWTLAGRAATQTDGDAANAGAKFHIFYGDADGDGTGADIFTVQGDKKVGINNHTPSTTLDVNGVLTMRGHILPVANNTYDLGSSTNRFRDMYTGDLNLCNEGRGNDVDGTSGNWTIQEGEDSLYVINNITGKKFKMMLQPVEDGE